MVLAGGGGRRLGGVDKAGIRVADRPLLDYALAATASAQRVVVVGPPRDLPDGVLTAREEPPGGGPVAGIAAGLELLRARIVVVLACDMPLVDTDRVQALVTHLAGSPQRTDGVWYVDGSGRPQPLAAAYRRAALRAALEESGPPSGLPVRALVDRLQLDPLDAGTDATADCDTWRDIAVIRSRLEGT